MAVCVNFLRSKEDSPLPLFPVLHRASIHLPAGGMRVWCGLRVMLSKPDPHVPKRPFLLAENNGSIFILHVL